MPTVPAAAGFSPDAIITASFGWFLLAGAVGFLVDAAILGFAFDGLGAQVATTGAFLDNGPSTGVSRALGYEEDGFDSLAPQGIARVIQRFRMTAEGWRSRPRPALAIEGLDGILDLFGAAQPTESRSRRPRRRPHHPTNRR